MNTGNVEERRLLTILFADLSGFTALSAKLDPEEVKDVASICFEHLNQAIVREGGTIHKYEGDLVIALFGFPSAHEDDPERAIRASLKIMTLVPQINETISAKLQRKTDLSLHVGVNSGIVYIGEVGSKDKREYTVMGDVVNLASRLKDIAKRGEIAVSDPVFRASSYLFEYEACPPVSVKGIDEPVRAFKPLRPKAKPEPKRGVQGIHSPLVGRDKEFELLKQAVEKLGGGQGGAVFILGDAGLGKSRLLLELKKLIVDCRMPITTLEGFCLSQAEIVAYSPFLQILENIFEITEQDASTTVQDKLVDRMKNIMPDAWEEVVPYIGYLFSIRFADQLDEKVKYLGPKDLRVQIFSSVKRLLTAISRDRPLLVVIEDYHWIDKESLELLEFIFAQPDTAVEEPEPLPLLFVGLSRIDKEKECYRVKERLKKKLDGDFTEICLRPLDKEKSSQLLHNLLSIAGLPENFKTRIMAKAEGNPFYVEEIIRSLIDNRVIVYGDGVWRLGAKVSDLSAITIPDTVQAVIASRLDRLDPDLRNVLQIAAVIGRSFYVPVLEELCGLESMILTVHLATLEDHEFITEHRRTPEPEYTFRHPLLQEVVYGRLLKTKRKKLHRSIGEVIEKLYQRRLDEFTELLAYQFANSDNADKAIEWLARAGERAKNRYANDEAIRYFERVISFIGSEQSASTRSGAQGPDRLCMMHESLGDIFGLKGEYVLALQHYEAMDNACKDNELIQSRSRRKTAEIFQKQSSHEKALKALDEVEKMHTSDSDVAILERAEVHLLRSWVYVSTGKTEEAVREVEAGLKLIDELETRKEVDRNVLNQLRAKGFNSLGLIMYHKGENDKAIEIYQKFMKISEETRNKRSIAIATHNLGLAYSAQGERDQALEILQKSLKAFEEIGDKSGVGSNLSGIGNIYHMRGEYGKAIELYQKFLKISEEIGYQRGVSITIFNLASLYKEKGEYDKAIKLSQKKIKMSEESGDLHGAGLAACNLGELYLIMGEPTKAEEYLLKAEGIFKKTIDQPSLIIVSTLIAELRNSQSNSTTAIKYADQAYELARELKAKSELGTCYLTYGKIYTSTPDFKKAEDNFQKAIGIFSELQLKKNLADVYLEYARMLTKGVQHKIYQRGAAEEYLEKARALYEELKLDHKIKDVESLRG